MKWLSCIIIFTISLCSLSYSSNHFGPNSIEQLHSVLWMQLSAEYKANVQSLVNNAKANVEEALNNKNWTAALEQTEDYQNLPPAVIFDIDETVLDNSPYQAQRIKEGETYDPETWRDWVQSSQAEAIHGLQDLIGFFEANNIQVIYISNRKQSDETGDPSSTTKNLLDQVFHVDEDLIFLRTNDKDKSLRRELVAEEYRILMLFGDNLYDFISMADDNEAHSMQVRNDKVKAYQYYWGTKWYMFPNPSYGSWVEALAIADPEADSPDRDTRIQALINLLRGEHLDDTQPTPKPTPSSTDPTSPIGWCPPKPSSMPREDRLRIGTWNIENLHAESGRSTYSNSVRRDDIDYERIKCYIRSIDADILALQEVDGEEAVRRIVDEDVYNVHVSDRPLSGGLLGNQNTGFIYKKGLDVTVQPDFTALDFRGDASLRYGARIDVNYEGQTIKLMSVHLKSGCFENYNNSSDRDCPTLKTQSVILEDWIDDAANDDEPFIVLGDFNHRFNLDNNAFWLEIDDGQPANADLTNITTGHETCCQDNRYTEYIDHIVFDRRLSQWIDEDSFDHFNYRDDDQTHWEVLSDHCAVLIELEFE